MNFIHLIDDAFSFLAPFIAGIGIIAGIVLFVATVTPFIGWVAPQGAAKKIVVMAVAAFGGSMLFIMSATGIVEIAAQEEVKSDLAGEILSVQVNGKQLQDATQLVSDLRRLGSSSPGYHHSHPTSRMEVVLQTRGGALKLYLARDSSEWREYWIYYPKYKITSSNDIGKIATAALVLF